MNLSDQAERPGALPAKNASRVGENYLKMFKVLGRARKKGPCRNVKGLFLQIQRLNRSSTRSFGRNVVCIHNIVIQVMEFDILESGFLHHFDGRFFAPHCSEARPAV